MTSTIDNATKFDTVFQGWVKPRQFGLAQERNASLDGIRGFAALMVIWVHYGNFITTNVWMERFLELGSFTGTGLDLFFVISGFLLAGILLEHRNSPHYYSAFYRRRICRIFPLYFALLIAVWVGRLLQLDSHGTLLWGVPFWTYFVFLQNFPMGASGSFTPWCLAPTWSLAIEEQFYLVLPVSLRKLKESQLIAVALGVCVVSLAARVGILFSQVTHPYAASLWTICRIDSLALGVLTAVVYRRYEVSPRLLLGIAAGLVPVSILLTYHDHPLLIALGHPLFAIMYSALILLVTQSPQHAVAKVAGSRPLVYLGTLSYGIYLFHVPVQRILFGYFGNTRFLIEGPKTALLAVSSLLATILLAHVSWKLFERPILRWAQQSNYSDRILNQAPKRETNPDLFGTRPEPRRDVFADAHEVGVGRLMKTT